MDKPEAMSPFIVSDRGHTEQLARSGSSNRLWLETWVSWAALTLVYLILIAHQIRRTLWYDELITFYIAKARTIGELMYLMRRWDLNPPTLHLLARFSMSLVGVGPVGARLPSVVEFYVASLLLFAYARRRLGTAYAALPVLLLWYSPFFQYATEARSYALLVMFFSGLLFCWDAAVREAAERKRWACWGIAVANCGAILSHVFAPLALMPFWAAEAMRTAQRQKADYRVWAALLLPVMGALVYIPFLASYGALIYPVPFQAGPRKIAVFFWHAIPDVWLKSFVGALLLFAFWSATRRGWRLSRVAGVDLVFFAALCAEPIVLNVVLMWGHGAFWDRYCITTAVGVYIVIAALFGFAWRFDRVAGRIAGGAFACLILAQRVPHPLYDSVTSAAEARTSAVLPELEPGLPLVAASGLTFVEMDHNERPAVLARLYYLTDTAAATRLAHANLFEALGEMKDDFGLAGTVEPYSRFVEHYRKFLVIGNDTYPEDWLLRKLAEDKAQVVHVRDCKLPYKDSSVYVVTLPVVTLPVVTSRELRRAGR